MRIVKKRNALTGIVQNVYTMGFNVINIKGFEIQLSGKKTNLNRRDRYYFA